MSASYNAESLNTYHCICTTLILTTLYDLQSLPCRKETEDKAFILPLHMPDDKSSTTQTSSLHNILPERRPIVIKREDGFEKRQLLRCNRCEVVVGYKLDETHFDGLNTKADEVAYILPGSLVDTQDMKAGKTPAVPAWSDVT